MYRNSRVHVSSYDNKWLDCSLRAAACQILNCIQGFSKRRDLSWWCLALGEVFTLLVRWCRSYWALLGHCRTSTAPDLSGHGWCGWHDGVIGEYWGVFQLNFLWWVYLMSYTLVTSKRYFTSLWHTWKELISPHIGIFWAFWVSWIGVPCMTTFWRLLRAGGFTVSGAAIWTS